MASRTRASFSCIAVFSSMCALASNTEQIPARLGEWDGRPAWVAAAEAVDVEGHLEASLFAPHRFATQVGLAQKNRRIADEKRRLATAAGRNRDTVDDCQVFSAVTPDHDKPTSSLADLAGNATTVVVGKVSAIARGFYYGLPGSLLRLSETSYLKGQPAREAFFFYPYARIETSDGFVCSRPVGDFAVPAIGDRFVIFTFAEVPSFDGATIYFANLRREVIHESRSGLKLPQALRSLSTRSDDFDRLQAATANAVKAAPSEKAKP